MPLLHFKMKRDAMTLENIIYGAITLKPCQWLWRSSRGSICNVGIDDAHHWLRAFVSKAGLMNDSFVDRENSKAQWYLTLIVMYVDLLELKLSEPCRAC